MQDTVLRVPRPELGKLVNYVHAFTKVHGVHDNLFRAVAQTILDATKLGSLVLWPAKVLFVVYFKLSLRPGQPRLDSGSLSAGWLSPARCCQRAFGLPPICPSIVSLRRPQSSIESRRLLCT